jgi:hypothetical protein
MKESDNQHQHQQRPTSKLKKLTSHQVQEIDDCLTSIGEYGEVRLVVQNGQLRYINKLVSYLVSVGKAKKENKPPDTA